MLDHITCGAEENETMYSVTNLSFIGDLSQHPCIKHLQNLTLSIK